MSSFNLAYTGPDYPNANERIIINQKDSRPDSHLTTAEEGEFDMYCAVRFLADLPSSADPSMLALWEGKAIYQYVNLKSARLAPVTRTLIQPSRGEIASWTLRRFDAPLPIAHARAQIENTVLEVGAIGPAAEEIERLLRQLARLTLESAVLDQINRGLKAWDEYFERGFE